MPVDRAFSVRELASRLCASGKVRYVVVGAWNTLVGYCIFLVFYLLLSPSWHYLVIALLSHMLAVLNALITYRRFVFRSSAPRWPEYLRFNLSSGVVVALQMASLAMLVGGFGLHPLLAQAVTVVLSVTVGYVVHKHYSFTL